MDEAARPETERHTGHETTGPGTTGTGEDAGHVVTQAHVSHEPTLYAESIFHLGSFSVTNSLLTSWGAVLVIVVISIAIRRQMRVIPRGLQNAFELIVEGALNVGDSVTGDRRKTALIFPLVFSVFLFILINNWMGLLPGVGSVGFIERAEGHDVFLPLLRGGTADLNTTLALALISVLGSNLFGIVSVGVFKYFNKFVNVKAIVEIPMKIRKDPTLAIVNPIKFFVGEIAKIASLSFRLFGNIFAGEVLLSSMAVIFAFLLPIPFILLEVLVGIIQAFIFAMLTLVYFTIASMSEEH
jgi:F-type H+-transporting ATPase subunit a